jgi:malonyl CoA-acyl carrier protein transacylase
MTTACLFPGQGSQVAGMGQTLFARFTLRAEEASDMLGYSITALCLEAKAGTLALTQYAQPALYVVGALSYLAHHEDGGFQPDFVAGHSLGEYGALFAAGCFDFATGLILVRERARLMSEVTGTSMTAITQIDAAELTGLLTRHPRFSRIDVANYNTATQTVLSGEGEQLKEFVGLVERLGGRAFPLKVSAAFHSRYMLPVQRRFAEFASGIEFRAPRIPVIANISACPYPTDSASIRKTLVAQIASPVRWLDTMVTLHDRGVGHFIEMEPGKVLSRMADSIWKDRPKPKPSAAVASRAGARAIFMCPGTGGQYFRMGQSHYRGVPSFRQGFDACDEIARPLIGESLAAIVHEPKDPAAEFSRTLHTHLANFAFGYAMVTSLQARGIAPVSFVAWSLGEYVALAASGVLSLEAATTLVARQARHIEDLTEPAAMLSVLENVNIYYSMGRLFAGSSLAGIHAHKGFVVTGSPTAITALHRALSGKNIACQVLPVRHGFHSPFMDRIEQQFRADCAGLSRSTPQLPVYSSVQRGLLETVDDDYLWRICRSRFNFRTTLALATETYPGVRLYDIGPSGTSAAHAKSIVGGTTDIQHAVRLDMAVY